MTDRRRVGIRAVAIGAAAITVAGAGVAFALDPVPGQGGDTDPALAALERRERALAAEAERLAALAGQGDAGGTWAGPADPAEVPPITYVPDPPVTESGAS